MENLSNTLNFFSPRIPSTYREDFEKKKRNLFKEKAGFIALPGHSKKERLDGLQDNGIFEVEIIVL